MSLYNLDTPDMLISVHVIRETFGIHWSSSEYYFWLIIYKIFLLNRKTVFSSYRHFLLNLLFKAVCNANIVIMPWFSHRITCVIDFNSCCRIIALPILANTILWLWFCNASPHSSRKGDLCKDPQPSLA